MGSWVHRMESVDPESRTGVCRNCGPVPITRNNTRGWRCKIGYDEYRQQQAGRAVPRGYVKADHCEKCGFVAEHPCQLDVEHKDGNKRNGDPGNIWTICANCHRLKSWHEALK